ALAQLCPLIAIDQQLIDLCRQLGGRADDQCRVVCEQKLDNVFKVPSIGAEENGGTVPGRLDHVLTPALRQAAADEGDVRQAPAGGELAQGVEEDHWWHGPTRRSSWAWGK